MNHPRIRELLVLMADGSYHSGSSLGESLGISRALVWNSITRLKELGVAIDTLHGRGYRLANPLELLSEELIRGHLTDTPLQESGLEILTEVDSTSDYLRALQKEGIESGHGVLAEYQHAGRGRRGRRWSSPLAGNIYLSLYWRFDGGPASIGGLSLALAIAVAGALSAQGITGVGLKWPNDILLNGKKVAGILLEVAGEASGPCSAITGVGINVSLPDAIAATIDQPCTDLHSTGHIVNRNRLAAELLRELAAVMAHYPEQGLEPYREAWADLDATHGQQVTIVQGEQQLSGVGSGVDQQGAFLLRTEAGIARFHSGEVSLRIGER